MRLTWFLLARIAEDEADARLGDGMDPVPSGYWDNDRVLAECEAKRRIVELQAKNDEERYLPGFHYKAQMIDGILRLLALPYAGHPEYDPEWS